MDKGLLLVCPKLDHTSKELPKLLGCQKINGINPRSAIRQQQQHHQQHIYKVVQIWPGLIFFLNHNCQTLTCTCQSSTYSPPESTHFFQRSGSILMPFSKKDCGWWRIHSQTVWMMASLSDDHAVHSECALCPLWSTYTTQTHGSMRDTLPHTVVGVCSEFQRTGCRHTDCSGVGTPPTTNLFWKGHQDASRTLEKMCWLRRGVHWRLTCASKCLAITV